MKSTALWSDFTEWSVKIELTDKSSLVKTKSRVFPASWVGINTCWIKLNCSVVVKMNNYIPQLYVVICRYSCAMPVQLIAVNERGPRCRTHIPYVLKSSHFTGIIFTLHHATFPIVYEKKPLFELVHVSILIGVVVYVGVRRKCCHGTCASLYPKLSASCLFTTNSEWISRCRSCHANCLVTKTTLEIKFTETIHLLSIYPGLFALRFYMLVALMNSG